jgi:hypothetical protein
MRFGGIRNWVILIPNGVRGDEYSTFACIEHMASLVDAAFYAQCLYNIYLEQGKQTKWLSRHTPSRVIYSNNSP